MLAPGHVSIYCIDLDIGNHDIGYDVNDDVVASPSSFHCFLLLRGVLSPKVVPQPFPDSQNLNPVTGGRAVLTSTWSLTGPSWQTLTSPRNLSQCQPPCLQESGRSRYSLSSFPRVAQNEFLHCNRKSLRSHKRRRELADLSSSPKARQLSSPPHQSCHQSNIQQKMWTKQNKAAQQHPSQNRIRTSQVNWTLHLPMNRSRESILGRNLNRIWSTTTQGWLHRY